MSFVPPNHGQRWGPDSRRELLRMFAAGAPLHVMANMLGRSASAVAAELVLNKQLTRDERSFSFRIPGTSTTLWTWGQVREANVKAWGKSDAVSERVIVDEDENGAPLPEGVWTTTNGGYAARCRSCDQNMPVEDLETFNPDMAYCGGSYLCTP